MPNEPVTLCVSVMALPILTPVLVTWNSTPLPVTTVNEPLIVTGWFNVLMKDDVEANEALTAFKT